MSIKTEGNKSVQLIDRALLELDSLRTGNMKNDVFAFCRMLSKTGVDMFEVNSEVCKEFYFLRNEFDLICRIKSANDIPELLLYRLEYCVVDYETAVKYHVLEKLKPYEINITMELAVDKIEDVLNIGRTIELKGVDCIRLTGMDKVVSTDWTGFISKIKYALGVKLDFCPQNKFYCANSLALEALMNGADAVTTSFSGVGGGHGYASTEEVLAAVNYIIYPENKLDLKGLIKLRKIFERFKGVDMPAMKPITGEDVFKYESGIHADGIEKNPLTYEPFDPCSVGQERNLVIGKHSGKKAVANKLRELGINTEQIDLDYLLVSIREKSIELHRSLYDTELIRLVQFEPVYNF